MTGVANTRGHRNRRLNKFFFHGVGDLGEFVILFTGQQQRRYRNDVEESPGALHCSCSHGPQRTRQPLGCVAQSLGSLSRLAGQSFKDRLRQPFVQERADVMGIIEFLGEDFVGRSTLESLLIASDPRGATDQDQGTELLGLHHRRDQRQSSTHGVTQEVKGFIPDCVQQRMGCVDQVSGEITGVSMTRQINGHNRAMQTKRFAERSPRTRRLGEAMTKHQATAGTPCGGWQQGHDL